MTGGTIALLVGGGLVAVGGAVYLLRKKGDECASGDLPYGAYASIACRFAAPIAEFVSGLGGIAHSVGDVTTGIATIPAEIANAFEEAFSGGSSAAEKRRICERVRDGGSAYFGSLKLERNDDVAQQWCRAQGVTW